MLRGNLLLDMPPVQNSGTRSCASLNEYTAYINIEDMERRKRYIVLCLYIMMNQR